MNKHLKQLIDLSVVDQAIDGFIPKEEEINSAVTSLENEQKDAKTKIEELEAFVLDNRNKISKNEAHLAELQAKLATHAKKSAEVKSEKEMKALQLEEEIAKEQVNYANEEIARFQKIEDAKKGEIDELEKRIGEIGAQIKETQKSNEKALADLEKDKKKFFKEKEELVKEVPQTILFFYEKIRRWASNTAVVPVKKQACYGCFMKISDKVYADVIASDEIVTCPNCGRILYDEPEEVAAS